MHLPLIKNKFICHKIYFELSFELILFQFSKFKRVHFKWFFRSETYWHKKTKKKHKQKLHQKNIKKSFQNIVKVVTNTLKQDNFVMLYQTVLFYEPFFFSWIYCVGYFFIKFFVVLVKTFTLIFFWCIFFCAFTLFSVTILSFQIEKT